MVNKEEGQSSSIISVHYLDGDYADGFCCWKELSKAAEFVF